MPLCRPAALRTVTIQTTANTLGERHTTHRALQKSRIPRVAPQGIEEGVAFNQLDDAVLPCVFQPPECPVPAPSAPQSTATSNAVSDDEEQDRERKTRIPSSIHNRSVSRCRSYAFICLYGSD
jgi:hypothetical protein